MAIKLTLETLKADTAIKLGELAKRVHDVLSEVNKQQERHTHAIDTLQVRLDQFEEKLYDTRDRTQRLEKNARD